MARRGEVRDRQGSWLDRVVELDVGPVAHGGHCVARVDGRVVFVRHALPGERVRAVVTEDRHDSFCRADALTVLDASPDRVEPRCVWARPGGCGGCDFQHVAGPAQRALKAAVLTEQLRRLAGVERSVEVEELPGGALGWRHRVRLAVGPDGVAGLRAYRAHDVIPIADCPLAAPGMLDPALDRRWCPGDELDVQLDAHGEVWVSESSAGAADPVARWAAGREWLVPSGAFWQTHPALADVLCEVVGEWARVPSGGLAWDLYGGVGVFASVLAEQVGPGGTVIVVESDRPSVSAGRAALAELPQVRFQPGRVEQELPALAAAGRPDVVVTDPPRRGLGGQVVERVAAAGPARLVHVACDPAALARDVALLAEHGYRLDGLRAFDAFPMTHHVEAVALFTRG